RAAGRGGVGAAAAVGGGAELRVADCNCPAGNVLFSGPGNALFSDSEMLFFRPESMLFSSLEMLFFRLKNALFSDPEVPFFRPENVLPFSLLSQPSHDHSPEVLYEKPNHP
ncbi:MAG: hypothetical protein MPL62_17925, partial [Alphaproteobacteria bacterium]|nr:hypothetical protein [Alphaproteobacteria bacterium]